MSHDWLEFRELSHDPFMTSMGPEGGQPRDEEHRGSAITPIEENPIFSPATTDVLDDLDFGLDKSPFVPTPFVPTALSAPNFTGCSFGIDDDVPPLSLYPPEPPPNTPHTYPLLLQQPTTCTHTNHPLAGRPTFSRSSTAVTDTLPSQYSRTQQPSHQRSLSDKDAARPTFFHLEIPHGRTLGSNAEGDNTRKGKQGGNLTVSKGKPVRNTMPTSVPIEMSNEMVRTQSTYLTPPTSQGSTPTGTPFAMPTSVPYSKMTPTFKHMSVEEKLKESSRVIEIGAMRVFPRTTSSICPHSQQASPEVEDGVEGGHTRLLKLINEVESHLQHEFGFDAKAQTGVEMIRETLAEKASIKDPATKGGETSTPGAERHNPHQFVAPIEVFPWEVTATFSSS
ncbi:hypothetical protein BDV96DRAFT_639484 [Lophiotrema nucula]|uniref:Uncharacterized protein n=1 Tax=Lophiotrema nucula TaxID=690887 RepID=A0A6A5ZX15_9PLEO|nr:hypothetical protein BDV96DRAFT_639484 [Lophiotrema nucula]